MSEPDATRSAAAARSTFRRAIAALLLALVPACAGGPGRGALVFFSDRSGDGDVFAAPYVGSPLVPVARTTAKEGGPRYHAHRRRIVHQEFDDNNGVHLMHGPARLVSVNCEAAPVWSPTNDRYVYYQSVGGQEDLFLGDLATGDKDVPLTTGAPKDRYPAYSPDGSSIVFARETDEGTDLYRMTPLPTQEPERLTTIGRYCGHPSYSPDGRRIAFEMMVGKQTDIAVLDLKTKRVTIVVARPGNDIAPTWSLDGKWIAFGGVHPATDNWDVWEIELETGTLHRVTTSPAFDGAPVYAPTNIVPDPERAAAAALGLND